MGEDRTNQPGSTNQRVTVPEAAELLGITAEAVRMRVKRGTLRSERQGGRVFVLLGQGQPTEQPTDRPDEPNALISQMQGRIDSLERQLEEATERDRENRRIIAALTSKIPAIEAPLDERESSETVEEAPDRARAPVRYGRGSGGRTKALVEGIRKEDWMSERRLTKYGPGEEIEMLLRIRHAPMRLREATLRFFPEGEELTTEFVYMNGTPRVSEDHLQGQAYPDPMISEARMSTTVGSDLPPGVYRLRWVTVTTSEGREYGYSDEDLSGTNTDPLGFEIVEKADDKPALRMTISLD